MDGYCVLTDHAYGVMHIALKLKSESADHLNNNKKHESSWN